jgi:hypothetical protein
MLLGLKTLLLSFSPDNFSSPHTLWLKKISASIQLSTYYLAEKNSASIQI